MTTENKTLKKPVALLASVYNLGNEISGGDKILLNLVRYLLRTHDVVVFSSPEVVRFLEQDGLGKMVRLVTVGESLSMTTEVGVWRLARHMRVRAQAFNAALRAFKVASPPNLIYSASDFLPDLLAGVLLKRTFRSARFIAGFYLFAPSPFQADSPYKGRRWIRGLLYWGMQLLSLQYAKAYADFLFVTSPKEKETALRRWVNDPDRVGVVYGGVPVDRIDSFIRNRNAELATQRQRYDAVFVGRLHYQKGVIRLFDIWSIVNSRRPGSRLAVIGDGPLRSDCEARRAELRLQSSVELLGFIDGEEKWAVYSDARVVLHPATFDSGGMAAAEGLAFGLPGVSFDLPSLREYYPIGMVKVPCYSNERFADAIIELLENEAYYRRQSADAYSITRKVWAWESRMATVFDEIKFFVRGGIDMTCDICGGDTRHVMNEFKFEPRYSRFEFYVCSSCEHIALAPPLSDSSRGQSYIRDNMGLTLSAAITTHRVASHICDRARDVILLLDAKAPQLLYDIGAGNCKYSVAFSQLGCRSVAVDIEQFNSEYPFFVKSENLDAHLASHGAGGFFSNHAFEHIELSELTSLLASIRPYIALGAFGYFVLPAPKVSLIKRGIYLEEFVYGHKNLFTQKSAALYFKNIFPNSGGFSVSVSMSKSRMGFLIGRLRLVAKFVMTGNVSRAAHLVVYLVRNVLRGTCEEVVVKVVKSQMA